MHILFTTYEFVTEKRLCGGLGNYLANISSILAKYGHDVTVLVISDHNSRFLWKDHIEVITFQYRYESEKNHWAEFVDELLKTDSARLFNRSKAINLKIEQIHQKKHIDVIQYCGDDMSVLYRNKRITSVVRLSSFMAWLDKAAILGTDMNDVSWLKEWRSRLFLASLLRADAVYGPSEVVAGFVRRKLPINIRIIESPFLLESDLEIKPLRQLEGKKYLLFFGKLAVLKGIHIVKDAVYEILNSNSDLFFVFMGKDIEGYQERIMHAAGKNADRLIFLGNITDQRTKFGVIKNAFACTLPSRADNLPNTCIEAMGVGRVVIGTYGASFDQLIENKESGILIQRDSPRELVEAVRYVMSMSEEERAQMGQKAILRIQRMKPEIIYNELMEFYQDVIGKQNRGK